jgi:CheY-like chemotaxis protein
MQQMVLVIDDDAQILSVLEFALAAEGRDVQIASDGRMGLDLAKRTRPDVIVLDLNMPGMSGHEVVKQLRARPETHLTPVLAFTSEPLGVAERAALLEEGFSACLSKQAGLPELLGTLQSLTA